jgi:hypothetical protein
VRSTRSLGHKGAKRKTALPCHFCIRGLKSFDLLCLSSSLSVASDERPSTIPMTERLVSAFATITCTGLLVANRLRIDPALRARARSNLAIGRNVAGTFHSGIPKSIKRNADEDE